mgnify:CR=1 FL=1
MSEFLKYQHRVGQLMMRKGLILICLMMFRLLFKKGYTLRQSGTRQLQNDPELNNGELNITSSYLS